MRTVAGESFYPITKCKKRNNFLSLYTMVYLFLADGFEEIEAVATVDVLRRGGVDLKTVSVGDTLTVTGAHGVSVSADMLFADGDYANAKMLILPGGMPGTKNLGEHGGLVKLLQEHNKKGRWIAAICAAPSILGKLLILRNQQAVCYPGFEDALVEAYVRKERVMVSGNIVTSRGPGCAVEFALQLVTLLKSNETADEVAAGMIV